MTGAVVAVDLRSAALGHQRRYGLPGSSLSIVIELSPLRTKPARSVRKISVWLVLLVSEMDRTRQRKSVRGAAGCVTSKWIADLLTATQRSEHCLSLDVFRRNLDTCIERVSDGNISRFCRITGLSFDSVCQLAIRKRTRSSRFASQALYGSGLEPKTLLTADLEIGCRRRNGLDAGERDACTSAPTSSPDRQSVGAGTHAKPPISLRELATRLGYAAVKGLTRRAPEICAVLRRKYNAANRRALAKPFAHAPSDNVIRQALEAALAARPRIPLRKVTQTLGFKNEVSTLQPVSGTVQGLCNGEQERPRGATRHHACTMRLCVAARTAINHSRNRGESRMFRARVLLPLP